MIVFPPVPKNPRKSDGKRPGPGFTAMATILPCIACAYYAPLTTPHRRR